MIRVVYYVLKTDMQWLIIQNIMVKVEIFISAIRYVHIRVLQWTNGSDKDLSNLIWPLSVKAYACPSGYKINGNDKW